MEDLKSDKIQGGSQMRCQHCEHGIYNEIVKDWECGLPAEHFDWCPNLDSDDE